MENKPIKFNPLPNKGLTFYCTMSKIVYDVCDHFCDWVKHAFLQIKADRYFKKNKIKNSLLSGDSSA